MEGFLNRYRNITVLLLVIFAQLLLLAFQVKTDQDVRLIRVWTVTAVTPLARLLENLRGGGLGFARNYILLRNSDAENRRLREENGRLKLDNIFLTNELTRADRAKALEVFGAHTASKMVAATVIAIGAGTNSKVVFVDRGTVAGVMRGMGVVTPDGIVGKVIAAYPTASQVVLVTDPDFAAGLVSQKNQARGTLKGEGRPLCKLDYVPMEQKIEAGEWLYTSGDDRLFPRGFPVGVVKSVKDAQPFKEILVEPSGVQHGVEDVMILVQGVHQEIPDVPAAGQPVYIAPPLPESASQGADAPATPAAPTAGTEADKLRSIYKAVGDAQGHNYGEGGVGSKPPDFTRLPNQVPANPGTGTRGPAAGAAGAGLSNRAPANPGAGTRGPAPGATGAGLPNQVPANPGAGTRGPAPGATGAGLPNQVPANPAAGTRGPAAGTAGAGLSKQAAAAGAAGAGLSKQAPAAGAVGAGLPHQARAAGVPGAKGATGATGAGPGRGPGGRNPESVRPDPARKSNQTAGAPGGRPR